MNGLELTGITWDHPRGYAPLVAASEEYVKQFGITVKWEKRSLKNFGDQSLPELTRQFDLLIIDHPHVGIMLETGCVLPLDRYLPSKQLSQLKAESAGPSFLSYHYGGHQWALPVDAALQTASYRSDLLTAHPPTTWEAVFQLAKVLRRQKKYVGMALCPTDALCTFLSLAAQFGSPVTAGNDLLIPTEAGLKILQLMSRMRDHFHPESLHWNPIQLYDHMSETDDIVYAPLAFNYTTYARKGFRKHLLTYTKPPGLVALLGGAGMAVSCYARHIPEAVNYAAWVASSDIQKGLYTKHQGQAGNLTAWEDADANTLTNGFFANTRPALDRAYVRPRCTGWPKFQVYLGERVHEYLLHNGDPLQTLAELQAGFGKLRSG